ncbi:YIPF1-like protein, partial [Trifolium medium]|nr:YIPF1-like protein [Trifolium medium]
MYRQGWGVEGAGWRWRRPLFAWEEDLVVECCATLENNFLQVNITDSWKWQLDPYQGYSVKEAYHLLSKENQVRELEQHEVIWNSFIPLK